MKIYYPPGYQKNKRYPAIVFFFGGSWNFGGIDQFKTQAIHLASKGMIAATADYRVMSRHGATPFECVKDGKSAIRYLREHGEEMGVDPDRIAAGGGSAGGHIAAAADLTDINDTTDNLKISARPNALVLFNPVFNNGPGNFGYDRFQQLYKEISPYHNIKKGAAATVIFLGTKDNLVPVKVAKDYKRKMKKVGSVCKLYLYKEQGHGFFNFRNDNTTKYYHETLSEAERFLTSLGYIHNN